MVELPKSSSGRGILEIADSAARQAGAIIRSHFHGHNQVRVKGKSNLVTQVDVLAEQVILKILRAEYPVCAVLSEETNNTSELSGYTWIVDPLDGTNNFVFGIPFLCVNIALAKDADVIFGLTYDPLLDECFHAQAGSGSFLNGQRIRVSSRSKLEAAILGFDIGYDVKWGEEVLELARLLRPEVHSIRVMGSAALSLAYIAGGRLDLYFHKYLYPWDMAPGILLVKEAGGMVSDWDGRMATPLTRQIVGAGNELRREFLKWLADCSVKRGR
ncbi:MAG: inositol monophosphatase family protein [Chloroflexota bacterium]